MKKTFLFLSFLLSVYGSLDAQTTLKERLEQHVYTLAHDSLQGRKAGDNQQAANYIVAQWEAIGIPSYTKETYYQPFQGKYKNIIGILEGSDPALKDEYIVVGAHYDHLGIKEKDGVPTIYNGADDNASGVATVTELGRLLKEIQPTLGRSIILVAFDAEEIGLYGSSYLANNPIVDAASIKLMLSVDMVGWLKATGKLTYQGSGTIYKGETLLTNPALVPQGLQINTKSFEKSVFTATDTEGFAKLGIPTLAVTTGIKSPYHKPEDDADLIDYDGLVLVTEHLKNVVVHVSQDKDFATSGKVASKHSQQLKRFTWGVSASIGNNKHHYTAGALEGKAANSYGAGIVTQVNFGKWGIRPEVLYDHLQAKYPLGTISTNQLTIPLSLVLQTSSKSMAGFDVFLGGYYSHIFGGKQGKDDLELANTFYRNEGGLQYGFGVRLATFKVSLIVREGLTNVTRHKNLDGAHIRNQTTYCTLTYLF